MDWRDEPGPTILVLLGPAAQALELPARPADQVRVDAQQRRSQLLSVEVAVVVDPALDIRVVDRGQILQGLVSCDGEGPICGWSG